MLPTLFLSHGAPTIVASRSPAARFLAGVPGLLPQTPKAILMVSAHWETAQPRLNAVELNETIYDFRGFPPELYQVRYDAPGSPALAERAAALIIDAGFAPELD